MEMDIRGGRGSGGIKVIILRIWLVLVRIEAEVLVVGVFPNSRKHGGTHRAGFHGEGSVGQHFILLYK